MRILGIDPGSRRTGLGVVETSGKDLRSLEYRCIKMGNTPLPERLGNIFRETGLLIREYQPDAVAIEQVFVAKNANSALVLGQARGSAICSSVDAGLEVWEYSALQIKRAVVGSGNAKKEQIQHMVRALLGLTEFPGTDEADALACAICHIHTVQVQHKLEAAM